MYIMICMYVRSVATITLIKDRHISNTIEGMVSDTRYQHSL